MAFMAVMAFIAFMAFVVGFFMAFVVAVPVEFDLVVTADDSAQLPESWFDSVGTFRGGWEDRLADALGGSAEAGDPTIVNILTCAGPGNSRTNCDVVFPVFE